MENYLLDIEDEYEKSFNFLNKYKTTGITIKTVNKNYEKDRLSECKTVEYDNNLNILFTYDDDKEDVIEYNNINNYNTKKINISFINIVEQLSLKIFLVLYNNKKYILKKVMNPSDVYYIDTEINTYLYIKNNNYFPEFIGCIFDECDNTIGFLLKYENNKNRYCK